jgi:hypothetical protein
MARIKIVDLPADIKISPEEMKKVMGGMTRTDLAARAIEEDPWNTMPGNPLDMLDSRGRKIPVFDDFKRTLPYY